MTSRQLHHIPYILHYVNLQSENQDTGTQHYKCSQRFGKEGVENPLCASDLSRPQPIEGKGVHPSTRPSEKGITHPEIILLVSHINFYHLKGNRDGLRTLKRVTISNTLGLPKGSPFWVLLRPLRDSDTGVLKRVRV